jgi:membrane-associated protein
MDVLIDFILHIDDHLVELVAQYHYWVYGILFAIVFAETGLVIMPVLPGDSLLFACGALAAVNVLNPALVVVVLLAAAILGDAVNYSIGRALGPKIFHAEQSDTLLHRLINRQHLHKAHVFFEKHGALAIISGRFMPFVRTFVPFVAGAGSMTYAKFAVANVAGAILWVGVCVGAGYLFGNVPFVKDNFTFVALGIVAVSLLPMVIAYLKSRRGRTGGGHGL